jgi:hypothetical protein
MVNRILVLLALSVSLALAPSLATRVPHIRSWGTAHAHDAIPTAAQPKGWSYPLMCCSGYDCREVPGKAIGTWPEGYVIKGTGEVIVYTDNRIKDSPDGEYHWCSVAGADDGKTICLFVPPHSF